MIEKVSFYDKSNHKCEAVFNDGWLWIWQENIHGNSRIVLKIPITREFRDQIINALQRTELR